MSVDIINDYPLIAEEKDFVEVKGLRKLLGLVFRTSKTKPIIFKFSQPVTHAFTSILVFFPFLIKWYDENDELIDKRVIKPFVPIIYPKVERSYSKVIEIPINSQNYKGVL